MKAAELEVGKAYVLKGLSSDPRPNMAASTRMPPKVGLLIAVSPDGKRIKVKLCMGAFERRRWSPVARKCDVDHVERLASAREIVTGMVAAPAAAAKAVAA